MPFVWGIVAKVIGVAAFVIAAFVVAWYFYIHDHAARTQGGVGASLQRVLDADDVRCRDAGRGWRCTAGRRRFDVEPDGRKNCWKVVVPARPRSSGCVKVTDYVAGVL